MAANPSIQVGASRGNAVVSPQAGMFIPPVALVDSSGNLATVTSTGNLNSAVNNNVATYAGVDPTLVGAYLHTIVDVVGTVAANNFFVLFNPSGSTHTVVVEGVSYTQYPAAGTAANSVSMTVTRFTGAPSGGTQISAANIGRFVTTFADPQAQVFVGNPTVTGLASQPLVSFPPALGAASSGISISPTPGASFVLLPNQGVVWRQGQGDTDQRTSIQMVWAEK